MTQEKKFVLPLSIEKIGSLEGNDITKAINYEALKDYIENDKEIDVEKNVVLDIKVTKEDDKLKCVSCREMYRIINKKSVNDILSQLNDASERYYASR